jgi:hypothetical protein
MRRPTQEELNNPEAAYYYARNIYTKGRKRWLRGEAIIAADSACACAYAIYIIQGRFELGEPIIATSAVNAYVYAHDVIKGRWEQGEPVIATNPEHAYYYANYVIEGRFELGEPAIATSPNYAYLYAMGALNGRFELGEPAIATDPDHASSYLAMILMHDPRFIDFYSECFRHKTLDIHKFPQHMQEDENIQLAYFKAKVLK